MKILNLTDRNKSAVLKLQNNFLKKGKDLVVVYIAMYYNEIAETHNVIICYYE